MYLLQLEVITDVTNTVTTIAFAGSSANYAYVTGKVGTTCLQLTNSIGGSHTTYLDLTPSSAIYAISTITVSFWLHIPHYGFILLGRVLLIFYLCLVIFIILFYLVLLF